MAYLEMLEAWLIGKTYRPQDLGGTLTCGEAKANCGGVEIGAIWGRRGAGDFQRSGRPSGMPATRRKPMESD
jgi:hypothetical protein